MNIKEVSKNYDVTPHTLRYYEKIGLLTPEYSENGYRKYSYEHIQQLNTIRDLRSFDIPLSQIKEYIHQKNSTLTKKLLQFESDSIEKTIKALQIQKHLLKERIELIEALECQKLLKVEIKKYEERKIVLSNKTQILEKELYLQLKKLHQQFHEDLNAINQNVFGSILTINNCEINHQVFYCLNKETAKSYATSLSSGTYATIHYGGTYEERPQALKQLDKFIKKKNLEVIGPYYEFYLLDFHETNDPNEYITALSRKVCNFCKNNEKSQGE